MFNISPTGSTLFSLNFSCSQIVDLNHCLDSNIMTPYFSLCYYRKDPDHVRLADYKISLTIYLSLMQELPFHITLYMAIII